MRPGPSAEGDHRSDAAPLLDANVILSHLRADHPVQTPRANALFRSLAEGRVRVRLHSLVVSEVIYVLTRRDAPKPPRPAVANAIDALLSLSTIEAPDKATIRRALDLFAAYNVDFADAYLAAVAEQSTPPVVISFDRDFDRIPGIERREP